MKSARIKGVCYICGLPSLPDCDCMINSACVYHKNYIEKNYFEKPDIPYINLKKYYSVLPSLSQSHSCKALNYTQQIDMIKEAFLKDYKISPEIPNFALRVAFSLKKELFVTLTKDAFLLIYDGKTTQLKYSINIKSKIRDQLYIISIGSYQDIVVCLLDNMYSIIWKYKSDEIIQVTYSSNLKRRHIESISFLNYDKNCLIHFSFDTFQYFDTFSGESYYTFDYNMFFFMDCNMNDAFMMIRTNKLPIDNMKISEYFEGLDKFMKPVKNFSLLTIKFDNGTISFNLEDEIGWPLGIEISDNKTHALIPHRNNKIGVLNIQENFFTQVVDTGFQISKHFLYDYENFQAILIDKKLSIYILNLLTNHIEFKTTLNEVHVESNCVIFDSEKIWVCDHYIGITFYDLNTNKKKAFDGHILNFNAFDSFGFDMIATGGHDQKIIIWNLNKKTCIEKINAHDSCITCIAFNKSGKFVISGGIDMQIKLWNTCSLDLIYEISDFDLRISQICVFEDLIVSASDDRIVYFFEEKLDRRNNFFIENTNEIIRAVSRSRRFLICVRFDSEILVYRLDIH